MTDEATATRVSSERAAMNVFMLPLHYLRDGLSSVSAVHQRAARLACAPADRSVSRVTRRLREAVHTTDAFGCD
jgi:hypothetical protein